MAHNNIDESNKDYYFYDYENADGIVYDELWTDLCHEYEFSIIFLLTFSLILFVFIYYIICLIRKRIVINGFDILIIIILISGIIKLTPKVLQSFLIQGYKVSTTQTGCKLAAYTNVGMTNVITYLVCSLLLYTIYANKLGYSQIDGFIRKNLAWILLMIFAVEGVTGIAPAIYTDIDDSWERCNATQSLTISVQSYVAGHIILFSIVPFILPFVGILYPLIKVTRTLTTIETDDLRLCTSNVVIMIWSYIVIYLPFAILNLIIFPVTLGTKEDLSWVTICHFESVFQFLQEVWYIFVPLLLIFRDLELSRNMALKSAIQRFYNSKFGNSRKQCQNNTHRLSNVQIE